MEWIYRNFPNPSHIALTGCSAGASVLPLVYQLLHRHYNSVLKGGRSVNINTMMDSPVYLTPQSFMYNDIQNWYPWSIMQRAKFSSTRWMYSDWFSTKLWEHSIASGSKKDNWAIISYTNVSSSNASLQLVYVTLTY